MIELEDSSVCFSHISQNHNQCVFPTAVTENALLIKEMKRMAYCNSEHTSLHCLGDETRGETDIPIMHLLHAANGHEVNYSLHLIN
jgi:hypothetical protein